MDTSHLDLSRFRKMTREEYYSNNWATSGDEITFAEELDTFPPYERHNRCHEYAEQNEEFQASDAWNLWACHHRERFLEKSNDINELYQTKKQMKVSTDENNKALVIDFSIGLENSKNRKFQINELECIGFVFPFEASFKDLEILGTVNFIDAIFSNDVYFLRVSFFSEVVFTATTFSGYTYFSEIIFDHKVLFVSSIFSRCVDINKSTFTLSTSFVEVKFCESATFNKVNFVYHTDFKEVVFLGHTTFSDTIFYMQSSFDGSSFSDRALFNRTIFSDWSYFHSVTFKSSCKILECRFIHDLDFTDATTHKAIDFSETSFHGNNDFTGTKFNGSVSFYRCKFCVDKNFSSQRKENISPVPDFRATIFQLPPNLNYIELSEDQNLSLWPSSKCIPKIEEDRTLAAKFRKLKKLANDDENHIDELKFFRLEMLARRKNELSNLSSKLVSLYEYICQCGTNAVRPFITIASFTIIFWALYMLVYFSSELMPLYQDINIEGNFWLDMFKYSFHNILPILSSTESEKTVVIDALFGGYEHRPWYFGALSFVQNIIGLGLLFLILLGIRNYFRMR